MFREIWLKNRYFLLCSFFFISVKNLGFWLFFYWPCFYSSLILFARFHKNAPGCAVPDRHYKSKKDNHFLRKCFLYKFSLFQLLEFRSTKWHLKENWNYNKGIFKRFQSMYHEVQNFEAIYFARPGRPSFNVTWPVIARLVCAIYTSDYYFIRAQLFKAILPTSLLRQVALLFLTDNIRSSGFYAKWWTCLVHDEKRT